MKNRESIIVLLTLALAFQLQDALAGNKLSLAKRGDGVVTIELNNADAIAGFQFSINGRGGIVLGAFEGSERVKLAGLGIYQYLKDDETLTVVILAPVRSALPAGTGSVGDISFRLSQAPGMDTVRVFLTNVVICDRNAFTLDISTGQVAWSTRETQGVQPSLVTLEQNYPNPFNPSTTIAYKLEKPSQVHLAVYDIAGRLMNTITNGYQPAGQYSVRWNAEDERGSKLASGMYFARLQVGNQIAVKKMILAK